MRGRPPLTLQLWTQTCPHSSPPTFLNPWSKLLGTIFHLSVPMASLSLGKHHFYKRMFP